MLARSATHMPNATLISSRRSRDALSVLYLTTTHGNKACQYNWPDLSSLRKRDRVILMFKILKGQVAIPPEDYVTHSITATRRKHDFKLNTSSPSLDVFKYSFFSQNCYRLEPAPSSCCSLYVRFPI